MLVFSVAVTISMNIHAATWNPFKSNGRVKASTLLLAGNYVDSRLLAELAQYYSKQPVVMVSPDVDGGEQLFFMPAVNEATPVSPDEFMDIVTYVNPRRIVVLGGNDFVPRKYVDLARGKFQVITLDSSNWADNAASLGEILNRAKLRQQFEEYKANLNQIKK